MKNSIVFNILHLKLVLKVNKNDISLELPYALQHIKLADSFKRGLITLLTKYVDILGML